MSYDEKCYELAEYFLPRSNETQRMGLAQAIQDVVEDWKDEEDEAPASKETRD